MMEEVLSILICIDDQKTLAEVEAAIVQVAHENSIQLTHIEPERTGQEFYELDSVIALMSDGAVTIGLSLLASAIYEKLFKGDHKEQQVYRTESEEQITIVDKSQGLKIILKSKKRQDPI